ncbi:hypothetical protein CUS_4866 [Ruminococcus albus 8]|uniref:Uncharacterized protein n=1 Tax=Ruminococcus albus 8 TaxID=246199 RepID=E9S8G2_RUMAL|nr:hypothetical protein CUS_4866 [Ruminococcus albus 8]
MIQRNYDLLHINTKLFCRSLSTAEIFSVMHKYAIREALNFLAGYG